MGSSTTGEGGFSECPSMHSLLLLLNNRKYNALCNAFITLDICVQVVASYVSLTMQVLKRKQLDSSDVQQVSVRRFSSFNLFSRSRVTPTETDDPSDGQWVEYRSAIFPQYSALLRYGG